MRRFASVQFANFLGHFDYILGYFASVSYVSLPMPLCTSKMLEISIIKYLFYYTPCKKIYSRCIQNLKTRKFCSLSFFWPFNDTVLSAIFFVCLFVFFSFTYWGSTELITFCFVSTLFVRWTMGESLASCLDNVLCSLADGISP